jgi:hypothetical protein
MNIGQVVLNVDGKRYTATFRIDAGLMTVTCGDASRSVEVADVEESKSVARTVLRKMVLEDDGAAASAGTTPPLDRELDDARALIRLFRHAGPRYRTRH